MKGRFTRTNLVVVALAVLMASFAPAAYADKCSTQTVAGDWGFTLTGTLILPTGGVPAAAIGTFTFDKNGKITSGTEARNVGGGYADETITGYWTINSDCIGTLYADVYEATQLVRISVATIVFDDNFKQLRMVQKSLTLPNGKTQLPVVITLEGRKQQGSAQ